MEGDDFVLDGGEFALVVFSAHLVFVELPQERFEFIPFEAISLERLLEFVVGVPQFDYLLLVLF